MNIRDFDSYVYDLFGKEKLKLAEGKNEFGFTIEGKNDVKIIGYATNLTPETVEEAINNKIDLMVTHHDAWDFVYGMREYCVDKLKEHNISHYYIHLPLDDADFGNNVSLAGKLGLKVIDKFAIEEGFYCGRVCEFDEPIDFKELVIKLENVLEEQVKSWKNNNNLVKRVGILTGAGLSTKDVKEAADKNCDVYITGEKILYTVQYAKFSKMNLIVGSHTFTEIFGLESLVKKVKEKFGDVEVVRLNEEHIE